MKEYIYKSFARYAAKMNQSMFSFVFESLSTMVDSRNSLIDICSGNGFFAHSLIERNSFQNAISVDLIPADTSLNHLFVVADLCIDNIDIELKKVDVLSINNSFHLLPNLNGVSKVIKVADPEYVFITTPEKFVLKRLAESGYSLNHLDRDPVVFFRELGFVEVKSIKFCKYHYKLSKLNFIFAFIVHILSVRLFYKLFQNGAFYQASLFRKTSDLNKVGISNFF